MRRQLLRAVPMLRYRLPGNHDESFGLYGEPVSHRSVSPLTCRYGYHMEIYPKLLEVPTEVEEYGSMTTEWDAYFASQKYESRDNEWRNAVLEVLAEMNILEDEHKSDPYKAVRAVADEGGRRVLCRRSTD